ncbi:MAG: hypothetical protein U1E65_14270 [Myxococcota bacterium]
MSLHLGKVLDPAGVFSKEGPHLPDPAGILGGGKDGGGSPLDPLGIFGKNFNPLDPLGIFGGGKDSQSASSADGSSGAQGAGFNPFDPLGILAKLGIPTPMDLLKSAQPEAASLVGGFPQGQG